MPEDIDESQLPQLSAFERIKHRNEDGREWWSARELMLLLSYAKWQDFHKVIQAASEVYRNSGGEDADANFMAKRKDSPTARKKYPQLDYELTRHACYLVVRAPVTGHHIQRGHRPLPLWEWGMLSA